MNEQTHPGTPAEILVDADACPVKDEIYRVSARYQLPVFVVANSFMMIPQSPLIERVIVGSGFDAADDWIAERASASRSEERRVGKECVRRVDPGGRRILKKKKT